MNPWWLVATSIFDAFQKNSAEKKRRKRELEQIRIQDEIARIGVEDTGRWMGDVNKKDWIMKGETDPALWSTIAQYVNPIDHEAQAQINADLYDTTTDVADIEAVPTGFVAEGYAPSAAAAATRVAGNVAARNKLLGANQAYAMQDQAMGAQAGHALKNVYDVRNLGGSLAQMLATEQHEPTNVDDLNEQLVALGAPITAPINTTGILTGIANIQNNNAMIKAMG
tara:strand:- start:4044 stop:4718 length:675 start_codon:yes stop_codon:yes gene_type:complete